MPKMKAPNYTQSDMDEWMERLAVRNKECEQLERERDEARKDLEFRRGLGKVQEEYLEKARQERDELQKAVNGLCEHFGVRPANTTLLAVEVLRIQRERDELQDALEHAQMTIGSIVSPSDKATLELIKVTKERDEAREALKKCREDSICYAEHMRMCGYSEAYKESKENADRAERILKETK